MQGRIADELDGFDPALFGTWQAAPVYGAGICIEDRALAADARAALEVKSADGLPSPGEELRRLLNDMTVEMRAQFATFREMREGAAKALAEGDEAAQKLARADVKAATDAMSLIVRTLEKIDSLQRQLARDREIEAERVADEGGYEAAKARFMKMIEDRANERAAKLYEIWKREGPPEWLVAEPGREAAEPADEEQGDGGRGPQDGEGFEAKEPGRGDDRSRA